MKQIDHIDSYDRFLSERHVASKQTTLRLPDDLYREAKAATHGATILSYDKGLK